MSEPVLYDWAVEIPEWGPHRQRSEGETSLVARAGLFGLPELCRASPGPGGSRARLTRRGRVALLAVVGVALAMAAVAVVLSAGAAGASDTRPGAARPSSGSTVVVRDGDTLWGIAERARPGDDPRRTVHEIVEVNDLPRSGLHPGQELLLPAP